MDKERNEITDILLNAVLEIIYLLTGEDYTVVKKTSGDCVTPIIHLQESGGWSRTPGPITEPPPHLLSNKEKILELANKMTELLTGEAPIRCQDVAVYFSMEEWEYIEGHKDLYKDIMTEDHRQITSHDGSSRRNPPERCPRPLYSQDPPEEDPNVPETQQDENLMDIKTEVKDEAEETEHPHRLIGRNPPERLPHPLYSQDCPQEDPNVPEIQQAESLNDIKVKVIDEDELDIRSGYQYGLHERWPSPLYSQDPPEEDPNVPENQQGEGLTDIKVEEEDEWMMGDHLCENEMEEEERIMDGHLCRSEVEDEIPVDVTAVNFMFSVSDEDEDLWQRSSRENPTTLVVHPGLHSTDLSYNPPHQKEPSDQSQIVTPSTGLEGGGRFQCGKQFTESSRLLTHRRIHTGEKPYSCFECGKSFTGKSSLVTHERIHTGKKPFSCSVCRRCFTSKSNLVKHARIHVGAKPFSCSLCGKCFTDKSNLVTHERSHTGEKPYSCSLCGKCFSQKSNLVIHERIHSGEKPYSCEECGNCFKDKLKLVAHERIHTGEKPYSCLECGKRFTHISNLIRHERIHTGEKPYPCSECEKCFARKSDLVGHERSHTGEKPYSCSECGRRFSGKSNLVKHERIHTGERPYSCSECGKCFTGKSNLVKHEKIHKEEKLYSCSK